MRRRRLHRRGKLVGNCRGVLFGVAALERSLVLVPILEQRVVLGQHEPQPCQEDAEHIADMRAVLQWRPGLLVGAQVHVGAGQH